MSYLLALYLSKHLLIVIFFNICNILIIFDSCRYEVKQHKKMVRIMTVVAYVICVSMAAIVLSLYYVFLWDPNMTKYRDISETDCDQLILRLKNDKSEERLRKDLQQIWNCKVSGKDSQEDGNNSSLTGM